MRVEKEKRKVYVICTDGLLIKGVVHINPGERVIDFVNDQKEDFIAVTSAEIFNMKEVHSFKLFSEMARKKNVLIVNKNSIGFIEEL